MIRHVGIDSLMPRRCDSIAFDQWTPGECALQRISRPLQPDIRLSRSKYDTGRRLGARLLDLDEVARADACVRALQTIEPDDVDTFILAVWANRARCGRA